MGQPTSAAGQVEHPSARREHRLNERQLALVHAGATGVSKALGVIARYDLGLLVEVAGAHFSPPRWARRALQGTRAQVTGPSRMGRLPPVEPAAQLGYLVGFRQGEVILISRKIGGLEQLERARLGMFDNL